MEKIKGLSEENIIKRVNENRVSQINDIENLKVFEVDPNTLIDHRRFDIVAKYIYAWYREKNIDSNWGARLYDEHMWAFNRYDEDDGSGKKGLKAFYNSFDLTLKSMKANGFNETVSLLPVGKNNVPLDGAHRLAAALLYKEKVKIVKFEGDDVNYNFQFFKQKGLLSKWSDAIAYEYCRLKQNTYIVILFPETAEKWKEASEILRQYGYIYYEKEINLEKEGPKNLLIQLYKDQKWVENLKGNGKGAHEKVASYFNGRSSIKLKAIVFETNDREGGMKAKADIRAFNKKGDPIIYINSTPNEKIRLAQTFFNKNSLHFINNALLSKYEMFQKEIDKYKDFLKVRNIDSESCCVVSDGVMAAYGMKELREISFLYSGFDYIESEATYINGLVSYNDRLTHHKKTKDDIIFNPENHFYYDGIKFASLQIVKEMMKKSNKPIAKEDLGMINSYMGSWIGSIDFEQLIYKIKKILWITRLRIGASRVKWKKSIKRIIFR